MKRVFGFIAAASALLIVCALALGIFAVIAPARLLVLAKRKR